MTSQSIPVPKLRVHVCSEHGTEPPVAASNNPALYLAADVPKPICTTRLRSLTVVIAPAADASRRRSCLAEPPSG